jgi:hypothetical protein
VHEVVRDVDALAGAGEARGIAYVAAANLAAERAQPLGARGVADEAANRGAGVDERRGQAPADEAGSAGD